jgi:hypothetical protein
MHSLQGVLHVVASRTHANSTGVMTAATVALRKQVHGSGLRPPAARPPSGMPSAHRPACPTGAGQTDSGGGSRVSNVPRWSPQASIPHPASIVAAGNHAWRAPALTARGRARPSLRAVPPRACAATGSRAVFRTACWRHSLRVARCGPVSSFQEARSQRGTVDSGAPADTVRAQEGGRSRAAGGAHDTHLPELPPACCPGEPPAARRSAPGTRAARTPRTRTRSARQNAHRLHDQTRRRAP